MNIEKLKIKSKIANRKQAIKLIKYIKKELRTSVNKGYIGIKREVTSYFEDNIDLVSRYFKKKGLSSVVYKEDNKIYIKIKFFYLLDEKK